MYDKLNSTEKFGVSILSEEQKDLSMVFARQKKQDSPINFIEQDGVPVLENALATLSCTVKEKVRAGDHLIYIAEVTDLQLTEGSPIIFFGGQYRTVHQDDKN